jgi:hypothetical protein
LKPLKCKFAKKNIKFLRHIIGGGELKLDPEKVQTVVLCVSPSEPEEVRQFLGLSGYYRRFIQDFAVIFIPLVILTKKNVPFMWIGRCQELFELLKTLLIHEPILIVADTSRSYILMTNISEGAIATILAQDLGKKVNEKHKKDEHVVAYASRVLNKAERNYLITEKECLSVVN